MVFRCWAAGEDAARPRWPSPEIAVADLTAFALQAACWGDPGASGLALLDPPPAGAMAAARETLRAIGAVDADGRADPRAAPGWPAPACTRGWRAPCSTARRWSGSAAPPRSSRC